MSRLNSSGDCRKLIASTFCTLALVAVGGIAQAAPGVLPSGANEYGKGYDELATEWLQWATSIPSATNPIFDADGSVAAIGQGGHVWFLAGNQGGADTRTVTVPVGKAIFLPIENIFWVNTPENGDPEWTPGFEAEVRSILSGIVDTAHHLVLEIDGKSIPNVYEFLRSSSTVGTCSLPVGNLFNANPGPHPCVADGFWALLPPMSAGRHTIHFAAETPDFYPLEVTYHLNVTR